MNCLIELHYLPCIAYFSALSRFEQLIIEKHEHYVKQSYRNRCHVNTANGEARLIIPLTSKHGKTLLTDVRIDYTQKWLNNHWRTIESAYGNAPYFEHYADDLHRSLFRKHSRLYDLNLELLTICLRWLNFDLQVTESSSYEKEPDTRIEDLRDKILPKKPDSINNFFAPVSYPQVFGKHFVKNLSLVDLLFCEGPHAPNIIRSSAISNEHLK